MVWQYWTLLVLFWNNQGQPDSVQEALRFTMDVIGGKWVICSCVTVLIYSCSFTALLLLIQLRFSSMLKCCLKIFTFRFNSAKKDNDFIYHETVPSLETLASVKGNRKKLQHVQFAGFAQCLYHCAHAKLHLHIDGFCCMYICRVIRITCFVSFTGCVSVDDDILLNYYIHYVTGVTWMQFLFIRAVLLCLQLWPHLFICSHS